MTTSAILAAIPKFNFYSDCVTFGIAMVGNLLNLLVFLNLKCFRDQRVTLHFAVESIAIVINRSLTFSLIVSSYVYQNDMVAKSIVWCRLRYIVVQVAALIAFSMICLAAVDQFCSTNYRLFLRQMCTFQAAKRAVIIVTLVWSLHSLLFAFYLTIEPPAGCVIWSETWTHYSTFFFYPVLFSSLPIVVASLFSVLAYQNVRRIIRRQIPIERRRFDRQITAMVLVRVLAFVILASPFACYRIYAINASFNTVGPLELAISRLVQTLCTSLLYVQYGVRFARRMLESEGEHCLDLDQFLPVYRHFGTLSTASEVRLDEENLACEVVYEAESSRSRYGPRSVLRLQLTRSIDASRKVHSAQQPNITSRSSPGTSC